MRKLLFILMLIIFNSCVQEEQLKPVITYKYEILTDGDGVNEIAIVANGNRGAFFTVEGNWGHIWKDWGDGLSEEQKLFISVYNSTGNTINATIFIDGQAVAKASGKYHVELSLP